MTSAFIKKFKKCLYSWVEKQCQYYSHISLVCYFQDIPYKFKSNEYLDLANLSQKMLLPNKFHLVRKLSYVYHKLNMWPCLSLDKEET